MSKQSQAQYLEESFRGIRDEYRLHANTALRIGTALLDLLRFAQLGEFDEITFNKVLNHPTFLKGLTTLGSIIFGEYAEGLKGGIITKEGVAELKDLWVREHAKLGDGTTHYDESGKVLPALEVKGDSTFTGNLSSPEFVSEFLGGLGWAIQKKEFVNAAGETEVKYTLEIDNAVIRNTLRVFEMIVAQLLGENANRVFSDMMVVDHYDKRTGKVMLKTQDGQLYNSLRSGDYIEVQQYNGDPNAENDWYVTKAYEFRVKEVGVGNLSDGKDRLDWLTFENFTSQIEGLTPEKAFKEGDTLVRVDSERSDRKGVITIMAVGENTPYMDVLYGLKTDPEHALKGRLGNLEGIRSDVFGWLEGFGAYLNNLYAVGKFFDYQTGENLKARVEMTLARFRSFYSETTYNVSADDNFLKNGFFQQALDYWTPCDLNGNAVNVNQAVEAVGTGGQPLLFNGVAINTSRQSLAEIKEVDGIQVLYLRNMGVSQNFADIKRNGWHEEFDTDDETGLQTTLVADQLFMGIRIMPITGGRLSVRFKQAGNAVSGWVRDIESSIDWQLYQASDSVADPWEYPGTGKLIISYTGECYIRFVALQSDPIVNSRLTYSTLIEQNSRRITLEASRQDENLLSAVAQINIEFDNITTTVTDNKAAADAAFQSLISDLNDEIAAREGLGTNLASEISARIQGDSNLSDSFDEEVLARLALAGDLASEISNRLLGDNNLSDLIDDEVLERLGLAGDLASEITSRILGDNNLSDALDDEVQAREDLEDTYKATWVYQHDDLLALMAAEFDSEGKILGYADLKVQVDSIDAEVVSISSDLSSVTARVGELEVTDTNITARVSSVELKATTNETNIDGLDGRLSTAEDDIDSAQSDIASAQSSIVSLTTRVGELEVTDTNITARVSSVEIQASTNESNIGGLDDRLSTAEDDIDSAQSDIASAQSSIVSLTTRVGELEVTDTNITARVSSVEIQASTNETNIGGLDGRLSTAEDDIDSAQSDIASAQSSISSAQASIASLTSRVASLEVTDTNITARVSSVELKASNNTSSISGLGNRLSSAEHDIDSAENAISGAQSSIASLTSRVASLEVTDSNITARVSSVELKASNNTSSISGLGNRLSSAEHDIDSAENAISGAQSSIDSLTTSVSELEIQVDSISTSVTNNKSAADQAFRNINDNVIPGLVDDISSVDTKASNAANAASSAATAAANAQSTADSAASTANGAATWINQNKGTLTAVAGHFDSNGHLSELSGYVATGSFSSLFSQSFSNSGAITTSSISTYISSFVDADGVKQLISEATIKADKINFKTGNFSIKNQNNQTTLALDSNGNLTVSGTINGGTINNNVIVGTSGNKVEIYIDETIFGSLKGSGIRGKNSDGTEVMKLGFAALDNSYTTPYLFLSYGKSSGNQHAILYPDRVEFVVDNTGKWISFGISGNGKIDIHGNAWPTEGVDDISALPTGAVYLRSDSCLGIKR